jgi:predicted O-methyltransferase YrrM
MVRELVKKLAPGFALEPYRRMRRSHFYRRLRLTRGAKRLMRNAGAQADDARLCCDELWKFDDFRPLQIKEEIARLFEIVKALQPTTICEIGAAGGGTTFLFAHAAAPCSIIVSLDLEFDEARRQATSHFAREGQTVICLKRDSHRQETVREVTSLLGGRPLDLLFIDGDHSYEGVAIDFKLYAPLVRPGGLIAFHDIVPLKAGDAHHTVGGVPQFWHELKERYTSAQEIIANPEQSAFGIGLFYQEC